MISASEQFIAALAGPIQRHTARVALHDAYIGIGGTETYASGATLLFRNVGNLPVVGNPVLSIDGRSANMRSITLEVPATALLNLGTGFTPDRLIAGCEISIYKGVVVSDTGSPLDAYFDPYFDPYAPVGSGQQVLEVQVARLKITDATVSATGNISITAVDRAVILDEYPLEQAWAPRDAPGWTPGGYYSSACWWSIFNLIWPSVPYSGTPVVTTDFTGIYRMSVGSFDYYYDNTTLDLIPSPKVGTVYTGNRLEAISDIAKMVGGIFRNRPDGSYEATKLVTSASSYVWKFVSGENGLLVDVNVDHRRSDSFNAAGGLWSAASGSPSGRVFLYDDDPSSPTYWHGPFGKHPRPDEELDAVETEAEAIVAVQALLDAAKGRSSGVALKGVCNPLLLPGDPIQVSYPDRTFPGSTKTAVHIIDSISYPLFGASMDITTREVMA